MALKSKSVILTTVKCAGIEIEGLWWSEIITQNFLCSPLLLKLRIPLEEILRNPSSEVCLFKQEAVLNHLLIYIRIASKVWETLKVHT